MPEKDLAQDIECIYEVALEIEDRLIRPYLYLISKYGHDLRLSSLAHLDLF
jgi:hypothetical protein